jgi:hypothetical protein
MGRGCETAFSDALVFGVCGFVGCDVQTVWVEVEAAAAEVVDNEATDLGSGWVCDRKAARKLLRNGLWVGIVRELPDRPVCEEASEGLTCRVCLFGGRHS